MASNGKAAKIAISIDERMLARVERLRKRTGETRSAFVRRALLKLLHAESHRERIARYLEAYREQPESDLDIKAARELARTALSSLQWKDR